MSELSSGGFNTHRVFKCMYTMYKLFVKIVAFSYIHPQKYILKMLHIHNWIRPRENKNVIICDNFQFSCHPNPHDFALKIV